MGGLGLWSSRNEGFSFRVAPEASLYEMVAPACLVILSPLLAGTFFGVQASFFVACFLIFLQRLLSVFDLSTTKLQKSDT